MDKNKKIQEVIDKIDEENREIREFVQERYSEKAQQEESKLPYKVLDDKERNELIKYSEEMTTFKQFTEFLKIKAARAAGTVVGLTILAVRRIKSIFKPKEETETPDAVEETQKSEGDIFIEKSKSAIEETVNGINLEESTEEFAAEEPVAKAAAEQSAEEAVVKSSPKPATKVEVRKIEQSNAVSNNPVKNPFMLSIAADNNVKKAIEAIPTIERKGTDKTEKEKEIDTTTFE